VRKQTIANGIGSPRKGNTVGISLFEGDIPRQQPPHAPIVLAFLPQVGSLSLLLDYGSFKIHKSQIEICAYDFANT